jgi:hypothetical protein
MTVPAPLEARSLVPLDPVAAPWPARPSAVWWPAVRNLGSLVLFAAAAGWVLTYVRYQALAGAGLDAVSAASKTTLLQTGGLALLGTALQTAGVLAAGIALALAGLKLRGTRVVVTTAAWASRIAVGLRPLARARWHAGALAVSFAATRLLAGRPIAIVPGLLAAILILLALVRIPLVAVDRLVESERTGLRRLGAALAVALILAGLLVIDTWQLEAFTLVFLVELAIGAGIARASGDLPAAMTLGQFVWRYRTVLLVAFAVLSAVAAVADNADRPRGLRMVRVTQSDDTRFDALDLGVRDGRTAVLKITAGDHGRIRVASHATELPVSAVREVEVLRTNVSFTEPHRSFWRRLQTTLRS